ASKALKRLGLDAGQLAAMDVDARIAAIADRMVELGYSTQQAADTLRKLGVESGAVVNLMLDGGDAIRRWRADVEAFGLSVSAVDASKIEAANDAMAKVGLVMEAVGNRIAV